MANTMRMTKKIQAESQALFVKCQRRYPKLDWKFSSHGEIGNCIEARVDNETVIRGWHSWVTLATPFWDQIECDIDRYRLKCQTGLEITTPAKDTP